MEKEDPKKSIRWQQKSLRQYKDLLDRALEQSCKMFQSLKEVNSLVADRMSEIEGHVMRSQTYFTDEFNLMLKNKIELESLTKKAEYKKRIVDDLLLTAFLQ